MDIQNNTSGNFKVDYVGAVNRFSSAFQKFPVQKILYRHLFRGKGLEFDSYRDYSNDEDAAFIDWKASLRANKLLAKKYIEERDLKIYFLFDVSNSMLSGSGDKLKAEYAAEFILALSHLIMESGDKTGLILYNDNIVKFIPPESGKKQFFILTNILCNSNYYGGKNSLLDPLDYILKTVKLDYTLFIIVSDFLKMHKAVKEKLITLSSRFETVAVMIRDPIDEEIPNFGFQMSIMEPGTNKQILLDGSLAAERYKKMVVLNKRKLTELFLESNIDFLELNTSEDFSFKTAKFLKRRSRTERV